MTHSPDGEAFPELAAHPADVQRLELQAMQATHAARLEAKGTLGRARKLRAELYPSHEPMEVEKRALAAAGITDFEDRLLVEVGVANPPPGPGLAATEVSAWVGVAKREES